MAEAAKANLECERPDPRTTGYNNRRRAVATRVTDGDIDDMLTELTLAAVAPSAPLKEPKEGDIPGVPVPIWPTAQDVADALGIEVSRVHEFFARVKNRA